MLWHRQLGHLSESSLKRMATKQMVRGFNYNVKNQIDFCKPCIEGKMHRHPFSTDGGKRSSQVLGLVHSDVCGKLNEKSLGGGQYLLTFIDVEVVNTC